MDERLNPEIEALVAAYYAAFDNRGARLPAIEGLRTMFGEAATITRVTEDQVDTWSPDAFIAPRAAMLTDGSLTEFNEWETEARTIVLGNIASRWSTYAKQGTLNGADFRGVGRKFIQFHRKDRRWVISSILWEDV